MDSPEVKLPPDLTNWFLVKCLLQELQTRLINQNISDQETGWYMQTIYTTIQSDQPVGTTCSNPISRLVQTLYSSFQSNPTPVSPLNRLKSQIQSNVKKKLDPECVWYGMMKYLKSLRKSEKENFLYVILPGIIEMALSIEGTRPVKGLFISRKQNCGSTVLSREFVCSVVACFFLCLFPERKREMSSNLNIVNFTTFFHHLQLPSQMSKLRCILNYFECIIEKKRKVQGNIIFSRKCLKPDWMLDFDQLSECDVKLCPIVVFPEGSIEDSAPYAIQVNFANQSLGGGVLGRGRVQEEIKFCVCPELLSLLLFMESVDPNEAVSVSGFEQFSSYRGYADSLEFAGNFNGHASDKMLRMVAIDALSYREQSPFRQYEETFVMRDLNKALIGFCRMGAENFIADLEENKCELDADIAVSACGSDQLTPEDEPMAQAALVMTAGSAEQVGQRPVLDQSPDSVDPIDQNFLMQSMKRIIPTAATGTADSCHTNTFLLQPPAFISGIIHGNDSRLHVSPLSLLSGVSHIVPQPVSSDPSVGPSLISQQSSFAHSIPSAMSPRVIAPDAHQGRTSNARLVQSSGSKCANFLSITSRSDSLSRERSGPDLDNLDLTAVCVLPTDSSALTKTSSAVPSVLNESDLVNVESNAAQPSSVPDSHISNTSNHHWRFDILGNLHKVFSVSSRHDNVLEGISSSVDSSSFTAHGIVHKKEFLTKGNLLLLSEDTRALNSLRISTVPSDNDLSSTSSESREFQVESLFPEGSSSNLVMHQAVSAVGEEQSAEPQSTDLLYVNVEDSDFHCRQFDMTYSGTVSYDSTRLDPSSVSPQSSTSSTSISPHSSFTVPGMAYHEPLNGSNDIHMSADFFIPSLGDSREQPYRDSKELHAELREFLSSYSSGSRSSGSGPYSSCNSTWGSRSGSISSHGTNGSSNDFLEFWNHFRRRSSQLSDSTSRRSSSSKHSSDFSTDLEEISESLQKHGHGVIEEEGGVVTLLTDYASQFVSTAVGSGVISGANLSSEAADDVEVRDLAGIVAPCSMDTSSGTAPRHGRVRRTFSRAGTLVRQEKVSLEQEDPLTSMALGTTEEISESQQDASLSLSAVVSSNNSEDRTVGQTQSKPFLYASFTPVQSSTPSPLQSLDSGFVSVRPQASESKGLNTESSEFSLGGSSEAQRESISSLSLRENTSLLAKGYRTLSQQKGNPLQSTSSIATQRSSTTELLEEHTSKPANSSENLDRKHCEVRKKNPEFREGVLQKTHEESQSVSDFVNFKSHKERASKSRSSKIPEKSVKVTSPRSIRETKHSTSREAAAASVSPSSTDSASHMSSGASGPSKSSGIPKFRSSPKKTGHASKCSMSQPSENKSKATEKHDFVVADKVKVQKSRKANAKDRTELSSKPLKSRYVFSDVAAPPIIEKRQKHRESPHKKQIRSTSKSLEGRMKSRLRQEGKPAQDYTKSPKLIRFVNSIAEISLSQAVLEGAEILSNQSTHCREEISDEVYNWFANKIISEVLAHVIGDIETREFPSNRNSSPSHLGEIGASGEVVAHGETVMANYEDYALPIFGASARESAATEAGTARPKGKGILPSRSDTAASGAGIISGQGMQRSTGSLKMVKFKEGVVIEAKPVQPQGTGHQKSSTFQVAGNSSIPFPLRRRSSLDLPLTLPSTSRAVIDPVPVQLTSPSNAPASNFQEKRRRSLTNADLSVYQAAASIVHQVFQNISDTMDIQALSPVSSCYHGTLSSSDTGGAHSTGSRIHSHYDSFTSNIFSSSSTKACESPRRARRSVSPSIGVFFRKPMSRETLTSAYLKVDHSPQIKSYERRSSEPCQTSVQLSLQAFNYNKFNGRTLEDKNKKISRTDDDIGRGKTWRRGSLDGFSFDQRRNSCGFKDPVLSRFAEELMKADTSVPELVIVGSQASSSSTGSRRSSVSAFRDSTLANLENELLNTSFTSACSMSSRSQRHHSHLYRSRSRDSRQGKSDSSDTEYWFPPPKFVGDEFQLEFNRQHSQDELQDYASFFAGQVVQEAVCVLRSDPDFQSQEQRDMDMYAENLIDQIMRDALTSSVHRVGGHAEASTGLQLTSCDNKKEERGISRIPPYSGQGAIPKVRVAKSFRVVSQPQNIPQRKLERQPEAESSFGQPELSAVNTGFRMNKGERRASGFGGAGLSVPSTQQYLHPTFKPTSSSSSPPWPGGARPKQPVPSHGERCLPASRGKRHSSPSPLLMASSLPVPTYLSSSPSSLQVPAQMPQRRHLTLAMRSKSESYSRSFGTLTVRQPLGGQMGTSTMLRREQSPASQSSVDVGSDQTCSSLLYSSDSSSSSTSSSSIDSIGPAGRDVASDRIPPRKVLNAARAAQSSRGRKRGQRGPWEESKSRLEPRAAGRGASDVAQFSERLSSEILSEVMHHCRQDKWLKYLSYRQPIATGNWGCGAYRGNPQLKFVLQWMAASIARSPLLMYYTFQDSIMTQAQEITHIISGLTVGQLAGILREYCALVCFQAPASFSSPGRQWSPWQQSQHLYPSISLFDFLKQKFDGRSGGR